MPLTQLPMETVPDLFIHPGGYCQNVLGTGACQVLGETIHNGRKAILLEERGTRGWWRSSPINRLHDPARSRPAVRRDRPARGDRSAARSRGSPRRTVFEPDAPLPPAAFQFTFPSDAQILYRRPARSMRWLAASSLPDVPVASVSRAILGTVDAPSYSGRSAVNG